jgi:hypothetical protein
MAGAGTGYPNWFVCTVARRTRHWPDPFPPGHDRIVRTGRTRPAPSPTKGHPRKLRESHEYRCECGHVGWSCHIDILRYPI